MSKANRSSPEVRERVVKVVFEHKNEHASRWATLVSIASKIGCAPETLRSRVQRLWQENFRVSGVRKVWR